MATNNKQKPPKTVTTGGKTFEVPELELFCEICETTNYIYADMEPPYKCDNCGTELQDTDIEPDTDGKYEGLD